MRLIKNEKGTVAIPVDRIRMLRVSETLEGALNEFVTDEKSTERAIVINKDVIAKYNNEEEAMEEFNKLLGFLKSDAEFENDMEFVIHGTKKDD